MPLGNNPDKSWTAWLADGLGGKEREFADKLLIALQTRNIPKSTARLGSLNMWWRKDSLFIDVTSSMDGSITSTIHIQEYGGGLFVGRAAESYHQTNYYKRMAAAAFLETVDRCVVATLLTMVEQSGLKQLTDMVR